MQKSFYIGSLELNFKTDFEIQLQDFDRQFTIPVLPIQTRITIFIEKKNYINVPQSCEYQLSGLKVYMENGREIRLYDSKKERGMISMFDLKNTVQIYAPDINRNWQQRFRPWFNIHLEELLLRNNALILHSASIEYQGEAILFSAPSGTGKTTQTNLWHQYKNQVTDINGDRTILQKMNNIWYACGFPIYGSIVRCEQKAVPLKSIVILKQGNKNEIQQLTKQEKVILLYKELTVLPFNNAYVNQAFDLLENLVENIEILQLSCTISQEAVDILHNYLYKGV